MDGLLPGNATSPFEDHPFVLYVLMRQGGAQLVDLSDPSATLNDRRLAWQVFRDGAFRYVGFHGTSGDPKVAFGDRLDEVPGAVQDCYRIGLAKDTSPQDL